ncbi:riboflavin synthase [Afifella sp. H1R]|uniref:riboflavin synthase n=1 Tax=Afifella sp. H1R TaxID=2908841 RepID=UPI001F43CD27|nr:riboflavin synthase [Afifella sp. H1R]MCF1502796.1 riboflavin synthase [Afifella sp. H1R]
MFTGIITDVGEVLTTSDLAAGRRFEIATAYDPETIAIGASIACAGTCLTVIELGTTQGGGWFAVEASTETLERTALGSWETGTRINLERALRASDELGGHIVTGHIDGVAEIIGRADEGDMAKFTFAVPDDLARFIAEKGSVALDGTSLTVNTVEGATFTIMLIPHTLQVTTWGEKKVGDHVNLEIDLMARYLARLQSA